METKPAVIELGLTGSCKKCMTPNALRIYVVPILKEYYSHCQTCGVAAPIDIWNSKP